MAQRLAGKAAIITGTGSGIGRQIAMEFAREGASVAITDIKAEGIQETARLIREEFGPERGVLPLTHDIGTADGVKATVAACAERFGRIDGIVNNAANQTLLPLEKETDEHWETVQAVNVTAAMRFARAALPHLTAQPGGFIVNIASLVGHQAIPGRLAYCASKTALIGLTRALAVDLGPRGVRVNSISPGHIMSHGEERWKRERTEREQKVMAASYALCRVGRPEEIARVAVFLASDDASFITGQDLLVDDGMSILCPEEAVFRTAAIMAGE